MKKSRFLLRVGSVLVVVLCIINARPVSAQSDVLDGWFQCFTHYESGIELGEEDVIYYPSIFSPGASYAVPYDNMTYGVYANWVCTPFVDGVITLGVDLPNAVGTLKTSKSLMTLVVPPGVVGWTLDCAWQYEKSSGASQQLKNNGGPYVDVSPSLSTAAASGSGASTVYVTAAGLTGPNRTNWDNAVTNFPAVPSPSANSVSGWYLYSFANTGHGETIFSSNEIACSLQQVLEYDVPTSSVITYDRPELGWDYIPPAPTALPWDADGWATPVPWVSIPAGGLISVAPTGVTGCFTLLPGYSIDETIFGYDIDFGWDSFEICMEGNYLSLIFFDWNMGAYATALVSLGGFAVFYRWIRLG